MYTGRVHLLPFERLTLRTDSPPEVVEAKLASLVATRWFSLTPPPEPFRGSVRGSVAVRWNPGTASSAGE